MAIQQCCEICKNLWSTENLIVVDINDKEMCPICVNRLINDLANELSGKTLVSILQDY